MPDFLASPNVVQVWILLGFIIAIGLILVVRVVLEPLAAAWQGVSVEIYDGMWKRLELYLIRIAIVSVAAYPLGHFL